jgi:hypothetical protein
MTRNSLKVLLVASVGAMALLALPAIASAKDRNHDRIPDRWEKRHHLSLKVNQAKRDQDRDHLRNRAEYMAGDNPRDADSDNDGIKDGEENAGKIQSFDQETDVLTIGLFGGGTVEGLVTEETEIECSGHGTATASHEDGERADGEEASDHEEEAEEESGDDHGEEADDEGEADDQGDQHSESSEGDSGGECSTSDLTEGAVVKEADLHVSNGRAAFEKIELGG